jgi:hypothetical protein
MTFKTLYKNTTGEFYSYDIDYGWCTSMTPKLYGIDVNIDLLNTYYIDVEKISYFKIPDDLEIRTLKVNLMKD